MSEKTFSINLLGEQTMSVTLFGDLVRYDIDNIHADTTAHWNSQSEFVGKKGHLYIYVDYDTIDGVAVPGIKLGDGSAYLIDAPFIASNNYRLNEHINDTDLHIQPGERKFWNDKVTAFMSRGDSETLVLTNLSEEEFNDA